jgi:hypothetical protein
MHNKILLLFHAGKQDMAEDLASLLLHVPQDTGCILTTNVMLNAVETLVE